MIREMNPTVISLAFDPEGSGPDTHYKVLQTIAEALRIWKEEKDLSGLRILGYRNVWYRFHPADADVIVPVSLNSLASLNEAFNNCYVTQVDASFPSYEYDGPFSKLTQKIWVEQLKEIQFLLGKDYFYLNAHPRIRGAHGMLFYREMNVNQFLEHARELERSMEG
jgi:glucosamine-6-phosphate deaminase